MEPKVGSKGVWLFLGDNDTTSRTPLLNVLESAKNLPLPVIEIVEHQCLFYDGVKKYGNCICDRFLENMKKLILS